MPIEQEPKYKIVDDKIVNRATGIAIPEDEPIVIFRAQDSRLPHLMAQYSKRCKNIQHRAAIADRLEQLVRWQVANQDRVKEPDTAPVEPKE